MCRALGSILDKTASNDFFIYEKLSDPYLERFHTQHNRDLEFSKKLGLRSYGSLLPKL